MEIPAIDALREIASVGAYKHNPSSCRWIGVPTTTGTGSEVTPWATVWDMENGAKLSLDDPSLFSFAAIVDPELTVTLPLRITVSTALDAMCHAVEAYWSKKTNTISRFYALEAVRNICAYLGKAAEDPQNVAYRSRLALSALLAGLSFSSTRTTASHSISYPLTFMFGIEHGIAAALTLSRVMRLNEKTLVEKEALLAAFNGAADVRQIDGEIAKLFAIGSLPCRLSGYGVTSGHLDAIVAHAYTKGRMDNNPVPLESEDVLCLLKEIL